MRSLVDVVSKEDIIEDSEYMETVFVAVPKSVNFQTNISAGPLTH